jgi:hypothetical protein
MATFTTYLQLTNGSTLQVQPGYTVRFSGAAFSDPILVGEFQDTIHLEDANGGEVCTTYHGNSTKYVSSTTVSVNGGTAKNVSSVTNSEVPIKINFSHDAAVSIRNAKLWAQKSETDSGAPDNVDVYAFEVGNTAWTNIDGQTNALSVQDRSASTSHDFYFGMSEKPTAVTGAPITAVINFSLTYT